MDKYLLIGLTGGIGTGKSSVSRLLAARGAGVIDTDQLARIVVEPGQPAYADIVAEFGAGVLDDEGRIDRKKLAQRVFSEAATREKLEKFTHPRIGAAVAQEVKRLTAAGKRVIVVEVPLLFESGWHKHYPFVVVVKAGEKTALQRLLAKGYTAEEARARIKSQLPLAQKTAAADFVVNNDGTLDDLEKEVARLWTEIERRLAAL